MSFPTEQRDQLLKLEFRAYLDKEKALNKEQEQYLLYLDIDEEIAAKHSERFDLIEAELQKQLNIACEAFKMTVTEFLDDLRAFEEESNKRLTFKKETLESKLKKEYKMNAEIMGADVFFFGSELECYKLAYRFKNKENEVKYSENLKTWFVYFSKWFSDEFSRSIILN